MVIPPPVAVSVSVLDSTGVVADATNAMSIELPLVPGEVTMVTPDGSPLNIRLTLALNPFTEVSVRPMGVEVAPSATLTEGAEKPIVNVGVGAVTVSATVTVLG